MNRMVMIVYNEALDAEVMDILTRCALKNYTKVTAVFGSGTASGIHLGSDVWPGRNNILYVACQDKEAQQLVSSIREFRGKMGKEGVKAFILPIEEFS